ncbi:MAG: HTTM domain-containing protein [Myxococcota bacterium]|nr:HTTM domain-containing protein [Myxococcota bacterium]
MPALKAIRTAHRAWSDYWFAGVDARSVGLMRLTLGALLVWSHLAYWPELTELIGPESLVAARNAGSGLDLERLALYELADTVEGVRILHAAFTLPLLAFAAGFGGRLMGLAALAVLVSLHHTNPWMQNGGDRILRVWTLSLLIVPCTRAFSIDAWIRTRRGKPRIPTVPVTAHRMIQLQTIILYGMSGLDKLEGSTWRSGSAVYYSMSNLNFNRFPGLLDPILAWRPAQIAMQFQTWVTLAWELSFPVLILFWPTRMLALAVGVLVHTGIGAFVMVGSFSLAILWTYLAFLDPDRLGAWASRMATRIRGRAAARRSA